MAKAYTYNTYLDTLLSHVYTVDGGVYSANRNASTAFDYFADDAAVDDAIYFCDDEYFRNLKLYVGTAFAATSVTFVWEYYNGSAWTALSNVVDGTNGLTTAGENIVSFDMPTDWRELTVNSQTYRMAIRCRISAINTPTEGGAQSTQKVKAGDNKITATGGTSGSNLTIADIYAADVAGGWGVVRKQAVGAIWRSVSLQNTNEYGIYAKIVVGDNSTTDYFNLPAFDLVAFGGLGNYINCLKTVVTLGSANQPPPVLYVGGCGNDTNTITPFNTTCTITAVNTSFSFLAARYVNSGVTFNVTTGSTFTDCNFYFPSAIDGSLTFSGSGTMTRCYMFGKSPVFSSSTLVLSSVLINADGVTSYANVTGLKRLGGGTKANFYGNSANLNFINMEGYTSFGCNGDGVQTLSLQYAFDLNVVTTSAVAISGARVRIVDADGLQIYNDVTDANGNIAQQKLTNEKFTGVSGGGGQTFNLGAGDAKTPHSLKIGTYGKVIYSYSKTMTAAAIDQIPLSADSFITEATESTAAAYTGISVNHGTQTVTLTEAHTKAELYDYLKALNVSSATEFAYNQIMQTTDGVNYTFSYDLVVDGVELSGSGNLNMGAKTISFINGGTTALRITGGTIVLGTTGTYSDLVLGTCTIDFQDTGTFDLRSIDVLGGSTITVETTTNDTVTAQFTPGTDVDIATGDDIYITVESSASVEVAVAGIVANCQVRVWETVSGDELYNDTAAGTSITFNYTYSVDVAISVRVRKGSAATKYLEWNGSGTIGASGVTVNANLLADPHANATTHANFAAEWTITPAALTIEHTSGTTVFTTNELYTGLQDWADAEANMAYANPITCNVKDQSYTLGTGWSLVSGSEQFLTTGGIADAAGDNVYTNVYTLGAVESGSQVYVKQDGTKITGWWGTDHIDVLIKVKNAGTEIDSGNLYFYVREFNDQYEYVTLDASAGGRQAVALSTVPDTNNATAAATVAGYSDITITWGSASKDLGDGLGAVNYDVVVDCATRTVAQVYEYLKYVVRGTETAHQDGVDGELYLNADAAYPILKTAPFGTFAGGSFFGARGIWIENMASADALNYQLIDSAGTTHTPPTPPVNLVVTSVVDGSRIQLYNVTTDAELANEVVSGTSYTYVYTPGAGDETIRVRLTSVGASSAYLFYEGTIIANSTGGSLVASQVVDSVYAANGIDGSTITSCSVTGSTVKVFIDEGDNAINIQDIYNWYCYMLFTESGIRDQGWNLRAVDATNYTAYNTLLFHNDGVSPLLLGGGYVLQNTGGTALDCYDTTGNPIFMGYNHAVGIGSGLTSSQAVQLTAASKKIKYIDSGESPIYES